MTDLKITPPSLAESFRVVGPTPPEVPCRAILGVVKYLEHELNDYCRHVASDWECEDHIFPHVFELARYLAKVPEYAEMANEMLAEYHNQIEEAQEVAQEEAASGERAPVPKVSSRV